MPSSRYENSPPVEDDDDKKVDDVKVKLSAEEHDEFKFHLETFPKKMRAELLDQLRIQHGLKDDSSKSQVKRNLMKDYEDEDKDDDAEDDDAARKKEEDRELNEEKAAYVRIANARSLKGTIPSGQLNSGFEFTLVSRDTADISNARVILRKNERGKDAIQHKKTRDKVVQALKPEISAGNISQILTSTNADDYDVAAEAISSQVILNAIHRFCIHYDMETIIKIPVKIDLSNPLKVKTSRTKNAIEDWQQLEDKDYHDWQEFILTYGAALELESNNWLEDTLLLSMDKNLRSEVASDMSGFPPIKRGAVTMLRCIIKRMVVKNQEAKDALESYIKDFNITNFPGENVPSACLRLKAVAKALGNEALPSNVIRKVLDGFAKLSTKAFNEVCSSQIAMRRATFYKDALKNISLQTQLVDVLNDLENTYLELVGGKQWHGIGHAGMNQGSSFLTSKDEDDARALAAKLRIPWDEWVKIHGVCHYCGEKGHIRPKCPKYLADIASGKIKRNDIRDNTRAGSRTPGNGGKQRFNEKNKNSQKFKTLMAAFQAWSTDDNDDDKNENEEQVEAPQENDADKDDDEEAFGFFSALASLKE